MNKVDIQMRSLAEGMKKVDIQMRSLDEVEEIVKRMDMGEATSQLRERVCMCLWEQMCVHFTDI